MSGPGPSANRSRPTPPEGNTGRYPSNTAEMYPQQYKNDGDTSLSKRPEKPKHG